jgi:hypothetical protein
VQHAEADDIIGVLTKKYHKYEPILILSRDEDFLQLQQHENVSQYAPIQSKWMKSEHPVKDLKLKIMYGDDGDGVPNFLSPDDVFVKGKRQTPISKKKIAVWVDQELEEFCTSQMLKGFKRNEALISLDMIPEDITNSILDSYRADFKEDRSKILHYLTDHKMKILTEHLNEF